jgi:hypothetical protein
MTKNPDLKIGDWVIVEDCFLDYAHKFYGKAIKREQYRYPQEVLEIFIDENNLEGVVIYATGDNWQLSHNEFRLATKKEIKENTIKNIFKINI